MIIIYNLSGLLLGIAGVVVGFFVLALTGSVAPALLALAVVWFVVGFWWRNHEAAPRVKRPFPALFFIPLPFLAIPLALLAVPIFLVEWAERGKPADRRADLFLADERMLDSASATGDAQLSQAVLTALQAITVERAKAEHYHVFTRKTAHAVLVLVKAPNLKKYTNDARKELLEAIAGILRTDEQLKGQRIFIGIKGRFAFGAIRVPPAVVETGSIVDKSKLYDFYNDNQEPAIEPNKAHSPRPRT